MTGSILRPYGAIFGIVLSIVLILIGVFEK